MIAGEELEESAIYVRKNFHSFFFFFCFSFRYPGFQTLFTHTQMLGIGGVDGFFQTSVFTDNILEGSSSIELVGDLMSYNKLSFIITTPIR